jgi:hypothetical protein
MDGERGFARARGVLLRTLGIDRNRFVFEKSPHNWAVLELLIVLWHRHVFDPRHKLFMCKDHYNPEDPTFISGITFGTYVEGEKPTPLEYPCVSSDGRVVEARRVTSKWDLLNDDWQHEEDRSVSIADVHGV